jgi:transcriptional regulator with XRE-family HTH domain
VLVVHAFLQDLRVVYGAGTLQLRRWRRTGYTLSQEELAARVGLDQTMVAEIENGTHRVDALELARLATALEVRRNPHIPLSRQWL